MRQQSYSYGNQVVYQSEVKPVNPIGPELVIFDDNDDIEMSPRNDTKPTSSADLKFKTKDAQLRKLKINQYVSRGTNGSINDLVTSKKLPMAIGRDSLEPMESQEAPTLLNRELNNIEQFTQQHREAEKFTLAFAKNPENAIQASIARGIIEDHPKAIAGYLIQHQYISKVMLGQYFGKNKPYILEVLRQYCRFLNFGGLVFDKALRLLLSKFRLPGEAQQIERIVDIFSQVYHESHQNEFNDAGQIHVLSYSLIMLNTDAHNPMQHKKMTKAEFVKNTSPCCPRIPHSYLEGMYDRIVQQKFQTQTNYIEAIYDRLHSLNLNISVSGIKKVLTSAVELIEGHIFIKFCRHKVKSVQRKIYLSEREDQLLWRDPNKPNQQPRYIWLNDIVDLTLGCFSPVMKMNKVPKEFDKMCFSIVTNSRTLDLKARDPANRIKWVNYLGALLIQKREKYREQRENFHKTYFNKEKIEEIWNTDIFPHWDNHWDYRLKRPKHKKYQNLVKAVRAFCCCKAKTNEEVYEVQREHSDMFPIKTPLLHTLWKYGLPNNSRKTLWPIVIGNALGITPVLYEMYNKKKKELASIHKMPYSLQAINMVEMLAVIRPDISLVRNLLELAEVFPRYLNEYDAFVAFANMMHSHYFLAFFQGDFVEIDFRIKFFDYLVQKNIPLVSDHFKALQINSKLFVVNWFLSVFSSCFEQEEFLARIWDNFFLQGEIYLFKVSIAIIKYYEFQLKMSTFEQAIRLLAHPKETSQVLLFEILENKVSVHQSQYDDYIEKRKFAMIKARVQEIPLE